MSESPNPLLTYLGHPQIQQSDALEAVIEALPFAAFLVDLHIRQILFSNSKVVELTMYSHSELSGMELHHLIQGSDEDSRSGIQSQNAFLSPGVFRGNLTNRNQAQSKIQYLLAPISLKEKRSLFILAILDNEWAAFSLAPELDFFENLAKLFSALFEPEFNQAVNQLLEAGRLLSGLNTLVVYRLDENSPMLLRWLGIGEDELLPEIISIQDLIFLNKPSQWFAGVRPECTLHRFARSSGMEFIASAPVGHANAAIGLMVLADRKQPKNQFSLPLVDLLAKNTASLFERHLTETNLQTKTKEHSTQQKIQSIIEAHTQEGILHVLPDLKIKQINQAAEIIFGYTNREIFNQPVENVFIGTEQIHNAFTLAQQNEAVTDLETINLYRRNGESFQALARLYPIKDNGNINEIVVFIQDLSEQEQIRARTQQLENQAILGEVMAVFAHEVRNPINNISTGLQLLTMNLARDDPSQESIARMLQDCDRLAELFKSILSFSRPADYEMESLDISNLLHRLLERQRHKMTAANIQYGLQVSPDCPPAFGNPRALEQVFTNLITNAIQAMGESGGNLIIKIQSTQSIEGRPYVEVSVADTGPGIPKENQDRIFKPFFTTEQNGTGLGLAITKRIITAHKGNIRLTSFPGGTIFHVQLPVANLD